MLQQIQPEDLDSDQPHEEVSSPEREAFVATAATADPAEATNVYLNLKDQLQQGDSTGIDNLKQLIAQDDFMSRKTAVTELLSDPSVPEADKTAILETYLEEREQDVDLNRYYHQQLTDNRESETESAQQQQEFKMMILDEDYNAIQGSAQEVNRANAELDTTFLNTVGGFAQLLVPFLDGLLLNAAEEAVTGEETSVFEFLGNLILPGEGKKNLKKAMGELPPLQRELAVRNIIRAVKDYPLVADFVKKISINDLSSLNQATWHRALDDVIGVLDLTIVGGTVARGARLVIKGKATVNPASPLGTSAKADPDKAGTVGAGVLADTSDEAAKASGSTKEEIISDWVLPKAEHNIEVSPDVVTQLEKIRGIGAQILEESATHGINYEKSEKVAVRANVYRDLFKELEEIQNLDLVTHALKDTGEQFTGKVIYGKPDRAGWLTKGTAERKAEALGLDPKNYQILAKDPLTGKLVDPKTVKEKTEYFLSRNIEHTYNPTDVAIFGSDAVGFKGQGLFSRAADGVAKSKWGSYLLDITSRFSNSISYPLLRAEDQAAMFEKHLMDIIKKDVLKIPKKKFAVVNDALEAGSKESRTIPEAELKVRFGMDQDQVRAYYSFRQVADITWSLQNRAERTRLQNTGMQRIQGEVDSWYAKPISEDAAKGTRNVFDPRSGDIRILDDHEITELYKSGGMAKLDTPVKVQTQKVDHMIMNEMKVSEVPANPFPYLEGYFPRSYKEYYFVRTIPKELSVNGVKLTDAQLVDHAGTVAAAGSKKEADEIMAGLRETDPDVNYVVELGREHADSLRSDYEMYRRAVEGKSKARGEQLVGYDVHNLANIADPIESMFKQIRAVSRHTAMDDVMVSMQNRWMNTFRSMTKAGEFPRTIDDITKGANTTSDFQDARALWEIINTTQRTPSKLDTAWQSFVLDIAELTEKVSVKGSKVIRERLAEAKPTVAARKLPSTLFIALRPFRQALVQSSQLLQLTALDPKYMLSGAFTRELTALSLSRAAKGREGEEAVFRNAAKLFGVSEKEFKEIVDVYLNKSGLPYSIDANFFIEGVVKDYNKGFLKGPRKAIAISKAIGFDTGEFLNLTGSWLYSRRKFIRENPELAGRIGEKQYADQIAADARAVAYSVTQPGTFKYQSGVLATPLQFVSIPHKAYLSMTTSKVWSKEEKLRLAAGNLLMFGGYALGVNQILDAMQEEAGFEYPEEVLVALRGGLIDLGLNELIQVFEDDDHDGTLISFSQSFSPTSRDSLVPGVEIFSNLLDNNWAESFLGPLQAAGSRLLEASKDIAAISESTQYDTTEKLIAYLGALGSIPSGTSDYMKYRLAVKTGKIVSRHGDPVVEATRFEALGKLFGFRTYRENDFYKLQKKFRSEQDELNQYADDVHKSLNRVSKMYLTDKTQFDRTVQMIQHVNTALEPHEMKQVIRRLQGNIRKDMRKGTAPWMQTMIKRGMAGPEVRQEMLNVLRGSFVQEDQRKAAEDLLKIGLGE